jgi:hypothetical protein
MAALRGPSTPRKSSRFSSPVTAPKAEKEDLSSVNEAERAKELPKTFLDKWVEPPVRAPVPSFEDHRGLERVGVLEHFQPFGQPPTQKFLQKLKLAPPRTGRATPVQSEEVSTPTNDVEDISTASPVEEPQRSQSTDESAVKTGVVPPVSSEQEIDENHPPAAPAVMRAKMPTRQSVSIPPTPLPTGGYIYHGHYHPETIRQHVDAAVRRAEFEKPELVPGLRKLCADSEVDPALWAVLDAILNQSPTREQYKIFHRYVRAGKKEYSRQSTPTARAASLARAANNQRLTPTQYNTPPTVYSAAQHSAPLPPFSQTPLQPPHIFHPQPTQPVQPIHFQQVPLLPPLQSPPNRQQQMTSPTASVPSATSAPVAGAPAAGSAPLEPAADKAPVITNGETVATESFKGGLQNLETAKPKRSRSVSSSSSLSSAKSLDAETFAPAINEEAQINGARAAAKSGSDQRQAAAHKPSGNKSRGPKIGLFSIFPNTNKSNARKHQASPEIDELELSRRKQRFQQGQNFHEEYNNRFYSGESSERSVPIPVASLPAVTCPTPIPAPVIHPHNVSSDQAALSSPVDTAPPTDLGLRNGVSRKRSRNDTDIDEEDAQTPRSSPGPLLVPPPPGASSISRSGTPRGTRMPPAKKIKKSARVMVS